MIKFIQKYIGRRFCDKLGHVFNPYIFHDENLSGHTNIRQGYYCRRCGEEKH